MADKRTQTITKYLGDMKAVVAHVQQAFARQIDEFKDQPQVVRHVSRLEQELSAQLRALESRLKELGGSPTGPVKEAVTSAAGVIAGLYDKVRTEGGAKALRDDLVALSLCYVSYSMLHTTCVAFGDPTTAEIAARGMRESARGMMTLDGIIPEQVIVELRDSGVPLDETAAANTDAISSEAWNTQRGIAYAEAGAGRVGSA